ncbi:3'(2'),5'-bisphosphate nucleotidase CysQ [Chelativorans salis]|uniref:3'(2'),5'-bisphosphate nucleotidase CysQ n=1 Tax=Chelativorans salis TaxID=2978478 RepID=A0ABT2LIM2_9HYPH|nr:3'(2'),5'-bisphosphate nucleotidase CysQ [Chelativorans sp. EGI FJ00035]MCT7373859.1 3'(2'),5'-bisphosphate nucleotidase CysQ [Chelativorans sp. EGI FJ00035]
MSENVSHSPQEELSLIALAADEAGRIAMRYFRQAPDVWWKDGQSPVSEADLEVDRFLRRTLIEARPAYGWLSEETVDDNERLGAKRTFVVDPIDGTRAFLGGRDIWCVSIAVVEDGRAIAGVLDCPARSERFAAVRGAGAWRNGQPIAVRQAQPEIVLAGPKAMMKNLPPDIYSRVVPYPYVPSLAYRVAMVADGRLDATFIKPSSHDWDLAAVDVILGEAGGGVVDGAHQRPCYAGPNPRLGPLAAGSGLLLDVMAGALADIRA